MQRWEPKTTKVRASKKKLSDQSDNYSSPMPTQKSIKYTPFMRYSKYRKIIRLHQNQISQSPFYIYIYIFHGFSYGFPWFSIVFLMKIIKNSPHRIASRPSSVEKAKPLTKRLKVTDSKRSWLFCGGYGYVIWKNDKKGANIFEGSLEVKLPTIWTNEKQRWDESEKRREENRREEERRSKKRSSQKKEDPGARKGRKVVKRRVWPKICGPGGSKSRLAKVAGAEPCGQMRDEKLHAVVARSKFPSQNVQNTSASEHV